MEKEFNALIIGAGNIGAFFDNPYSENILTHAHAFTKLKGVSLIGFVDVSKEKGEEAAELWNTSYFFNLEEAFYKNKIDIVSVCVPDEYHYEILKKISMYDIKIVFAEKPLTRNLKEAEEIIELYKKKNIKCLVNYSRRFVNEFKELKIKISNGEYGNYICGTGYYGKGILHNGSHMIDFLRYLLGEIEDIEVVGYDYDFYIDDPSISSNLILKNGKNFAMQNIPCNNYTIFELELLFEKKRIRINDSGFNIEEYSISNNKIFEGYKNLIKDKEYSTELGRAMENAVQNIYNNLLHDEALSCTIEESYRAMEICERLKGDAML